MKKLMLSLAFALSLAGVGVLVAHPAGASSVSDVISKPVCQANSDLAGCDGKQKLAGSSPNNNYINSLLNTLTYVAGTVGALFIFIGGFNFITSEGNSEKAGRAKKAVLYAIIGVVVAILARVIVGVVLARLGFT